MSKVVTTTVLPDVAGGSVTLGGSGDSVVATGNDIRANVLQDAGGNAVFTSNGSGTLSGMNSAFSGALKSISTTTVSSGVASVSFTSGLDSTYDVYVFKFIEMHPASNGVYFCWQASTDGGSNYNIACTTAMHRAYHQETDASVALNYDSGSDAAQSTNPINICGQMANANDSAASGEIYLFSPSSTTYVKHWISTGNVMTHHSDPDKYTQVSYTAGYFNTTSAVTAVSFTMQSGNIDAGIIKLYGISKS
tara:strand:- start:179 stop:928 length:750 start_codon:yes stop_codon:yes gene_type:complete